MRRSLRTAGIIGAFLLASSSATARASGDGEAAAVAILILAFDVASLPADIVMAVNGTRVPREYAVAELVLGSAQSGLGAIGLNACIADPECKSGAGLPVLATFTAWTLAMTIHGSVALHRANRWPAQTPKRLSSSAPARPDRFVTFTPGSPFSPLPQNAHRERAAPTRGPSFALVPIAGDGRSTPAGIGLTGTF